MFKVHRNFIYDPSLVLYLPLYELDGAAFTSKDAYGHLCTATGATWGMQGRTFDGDDYINCGSASSLNITGDMTQLIWVNPSSLATSKGFFGKFGAGSWNGIPYNFQIQTNGTVAWFLGNVDGYKYTITTSACSVGKWSLIVSKVSGVAMSITFNGVDEGVQTFSGTRQSQPTWNVEIGRKNEVGLYEYWLGSFGEARIYNRALTAGEIQQIYLATKNRYQ